MNKISNNYNILKVVDFLESMQIYANILTSTLTLLEDKCQRKTYWRIATPPPPHNTM